METRTVEETEGVLDYIQRGGRLHAFDYTNIPQEEKEKGFAKAREYLNQPMRSVINGAEDTEQNRIWFDSGNTWYHHANPNNPDERFGRIYPLHKEAVAYLMTVAMDSQWDPQWDGPENFESRKAVLDKFLASVYEDRHLYAGLMALSQGKTGLEVYRDMQEHFDFWRAYRAVKDVMVMDEVFLESGGDTKLAYKPYAGVVGIWQPFNFSCIGIGDASAALLMGNSVVIHTSARNVGPYKWQFDKLLEAGVPPHRIQFVIPHDDPSGKIKPDTAMSEALAAHPDMQVIQFTGSHAVAQRLHKVQSKKVQQFGRLDYKLHAEASGYNPFVIAGLPEGSLEPLQAFLLEDDPGGMSSEEWDRFFDELPDGTLKNLCTAVVDCVTGLQAHKCSTCKEFIVAVDEDEERGIHPDDASALKFMIAERLRRVKVGKVEDGGCDMGALIDQKMHNDVRRKVNKIMKEGGILLTPDSVKEAMEGDGRPQTMRPVMYEVPKDQNLDTMETVEIFAPIVRWKEVNGIQAAIERANDLGYALTGTVLAATKKQAEMIREHMPQGVVYVSGDEGQVDGCTAAPAPQIPFGGSGKSGTALPYRPGTPHHPLLFAQQVSHTREPRSTWGQRKHANATRAALDVLAQRDPEGVREWVRREVETLKSEEE